MQIFSGKVKAQKAKKEKNYQVKTYASSQRKIHNAPHVSLRSQMYKKSFSVWFIQRCKPGQLSEKNITVNNFLVNYISLLWGVVPPLPQSMCWNPNSHTGDWCLNIQILGGTQFSP